MRTYLFFALLLMAALPLTAQPTPTPDRQRPTNYVVLLDLSDRLLMPDQPSRDIALVEALFARFERRVRDQFIVNANDRFRVVVAPQRGIAYQPDTYLNGLFLDLSRTDLAHKRQRLEAVRAALRPQLTALYTAALRGKRQPTDFAGCDLWQYANEQLHTDLSSAADNVLLILTDGYLDFEANPRALKQVNRATDSRMLDRLRRDPNWRQTLARPTEGLLPIGKPLPNLTVCVAEVRAKHDNLHEADLLTALWDKWLRESRVRRWAVQRQAPAPKSLAMLSSFFAN